MLRFGTDGLRGVANSELTPEVVLALGRAVVRVLGGPGHEVVAARDTRRSGPLLEAAVCAGMAAEGALVRSLGVAPTPAAAHVAARRGAPAVVVSASHNPFADNGVKVFGAGGRKLALTTEAEVEAELHRILAAGNAAVPLTGTSVGTVQDDRSALAGWTAALRDSLERRRLDGVQVVVDCANGAASAFAADLLGGLGAEVTALHAAPDGVNINDGCGSTNPGSLCRAVVGSGAAAGIALDGDADRCLAVDAAGRLLDGDQILASLAIDRAVRGRLAGGTVAVTVMSNLGLHRGLAAAGIGVIETPVGDRHLVEAIAANGLELGGEQSGHLIFADRATTGDGLLTAVALLDVMVRRGRPLAEIVDAAMVRLPQARIDVAVAEGRDELVCRLAPDLARAEAELAGAGRILVRPSGTEPVVRVMVEADEEGRARAVAGGLAARLRELAGPGRLEADR